MRRRRTCSIGALWRAGFTLVEIMVALVLTGVAVTAVYGVFYSGLRMWRYGTEESRLDYEAGLLRDCIAADLRGAFDPQIDGTPAFTGDAGEFEFFTTTPGASGAEWPLRRVFYHLEGNRNGQTGAIAFSATPFAGGVELAQTSGDERLVDRVSKFTVRYFYNNSWQNDWSVAGLPQAVEVGFQIETQDGGSGRAMRFVVDLPCHVGGQR